MSPKRKRIVFIDYISEMFSLDLAQQPAIKFNSSTQENSYYDDNRSDSWTYSWCAA
jgi:hypothetical protein